MQRYSWTLAVSTLTVLHITPVVRAQDCEGWFKLSPASSPDAIFEQSLAFDVSRARAVLFDGLFGPGHDTWEWNGSNWLRIAGDEDKETPRSEELGAMVFDSVRSLMVHFGGRWGGHPLDDTRVWNGVMWVNPQGGGTGIALEDHAMAFDSARGVTVLFGGDDGFDFTELVDYTFEYDGSAWTYIELPQRPPVRQKHVMAYDQERGVVVLFGGSGANGVLGDTWVYDGSAWVERKIPGPGKRTEAAMVYDADRGVCVLFGGGGEGITYDDTWEYDGTTWTLVDTPVRPSRRYAHTMTYDTARHEVLLYGGKSVDGQILGDTWAFRCPTPCYPDFDGNGILDLFDFLAFFNSFNAAAPNADCDGNGSLDLFDFLCYTNKFNAGC